MDTQDRAESLQQRAGWSITPWCDQVDISRAHYYTLPAALRPDSVKVGRRVIIIEQPYDWLRRIGDAEAAR